MRAIALLAVMFLIGAIGTAQAKKVESQTPKGKIAQAQQLLGEAKKALKTSGKYDCCIKHGGCDRCALDHQNCDCASDVKAAKAICSDCYAGWKRGEGKIPGVDPAQVKLGSHTHMH